MQERIFVYTHIPKAAGTTVIDLLRSFYGIKHVDVIPRNREGILQYGYKELHSDLKKMPWVVSLAGHYLQPWQEYGPYEEKLIWFTLLRDPIQRFISQYEYQVNRYDIAEDFFAWKRKYRENNVQVRHLAGEEDLQAAKQILKDKFQIFGLVENFNESLEVITRVLGVSGLIVKDVGRKNVSKGSLKNKIMDNYSKYEEAIVECNNLDIQLYEYAFNLYNKRLETIKVQSPHDFSPIDQECNDKSHGCNKLFNILFRNLVYKQLARWF